MPEMTDLRLLALSHWLKDQIKQSDVILTPLAADASFRRYFRVQANPTSLIVMDAPPDKEDCHPFVSVATLFRDKGVMVPQIFAADLSQGFLLLTDFGEDLYWRLLKPTNAMPLYRNAIQTLLKIQSCDNKEKFPAFDAMLVEELTRFREWYLLKHLNLQLKQREETILADAFNLLVQNGLQQPQLCVHRDYHSRNLMALPNNQVGVLDFQDAVWGPITYDLVSLLRDCYVAWPKPMVENLVLEYQQQALQAGILTQENLKLFMHWFDWTGMQRHLKAMYIFARKFRRDNNSNYLADIPRTLQYVLDVAERYSEFKYFREFLTERVLPYESYDSSSRTRTTTASSN